MRGVSIFRLLLLAAWLSGVTPSSAQPMLGAAPVSTAHFTVALPTGFKPLLTQTNDGTVEYYYGRQHEGDVTSAVFMILVTEKKEPNTDTTILAPKLNGYLVGYASSMQTTFDTYSKKSADDVVINGTTFKQFEWEAEKQKRKLKGRVFAAYVNGRRYTIRLQDLDPHAEKGVPTMIDCIKKLKFPKE